MYCSCDPDCVQIVSCVESNGEYAATRLVFVLFFHLGRQVSMCGLYGLDVLISRMETDKGDLDSRLLHRKSSAPSLHAHIVVINSRHGEGDGSSRHDDQYSMTRDFSFRGANSRTWGGNSTSEGGNNNICFCNLEHTRTRIRSYISVVIPNTYTHTHVVLKYRIVEIDLVERLQLVAAPCCPINLLDMESE
jgi:hypothetical protein